MIVIAGQSGMAGRRFFFYMVVGQGRNIGVARIRKGVNIGGAQIRKGVNIGAA